MFGNLTGEMFTWKMFIIIINTRSLATQSYYLPKIRTNYGRFNVRFQGPIVWNAIDFHVKSLSFKKFKKYIKQDFISKY
jgi:hypothetical protein